MDHFCKNHPVTRAISKCHVCQNYYCASCLIEGFEYYYCKQDDCLKVLDEKLIPSENKCPSCSDRIILELDERIDKRFHCPNCEKYINMNFDPPKILDPKSYKYVLTTMNQADIALIKSVLDSENVEYFIFGQNFLTVDPMIQGAKLYVNEDYYQIAKDLLSELNLNVFGGSARNE
jgi:hypothetical protein